MPTRRVDLSLRVPPLMTTLVDVAAPEGITGGIPRLLSAEMLIMPVLIVVVPA